MAVSEKIRLKSRFQLLDAGAIIIGKANLSVC